MLAARGGNRSGFGDRLQQGDLSGPQATVRIEIETNGQTRRHRPSRGFMLLHKDAAGKRGSPPQREWAKSQ